MEVSTRFLTVILSIVVGSILAMGSQIEAIPDTGIGIAPTNALETINVQTSPWADTDTLVTADVYNQKIYFVGEGIIFNVTEAFNSTHAVP